MATTKEPTQMQLEILHFIEVLAEYAQYYEQHEDETEQMLMEAIKNFAQRTKYLIDQRQTP